MPVSKNTWNKGLNSDLSKLKSQQDTYLDAKNIRIMTDEGSSTFAIENIKGNEFSFNLPAVEATYTITIPEGFFGTMYVDLLRNSYLESLEIQNIENKSYEFITEELNAKLQLSNFPGKEHTRFYFNSKGIVLYDFLPESSPLSSIVLTVFNAASQLRTDRIASHAILGWGYYNNTIVLISCKATSNNVSPIGEEGIIWIATYDNATNTIQAADIDGQYLNPNTTLRYVGELNLSKQYAIYKHLKCRYENSYTARIVWTDGYNNLRACNVLDPQIFATPPELFSYIPSHAPQKPVISIIAGGTLPTGKYQYFYQLSSNQGALSTYSPVSNLMVAYPGDSIDYSIPGSIPGTNSSKSMQVFVQNIDTNYDTIRTGYIVYQNVDVPEAFFFDERPVPDSGQFTAIHNGNENDIRIDPASAVANLNRTPEVFKTIDVVRNRLFAANAKTTNFDLTNEFDARAYRFDASGIARLYNIDDTYANPSLLIDIRLDQMFIENPNPISPIDYTLIPDSFDCINPFNQEDNTYNPYSNNDWYTYSQYKYQNYPPTIIGGKGLNISYQFVTKAMTAKTNTWSTTTTFINPQSNYDIDFKTEFSDTYTYPGGQGLTMDSMKNPILETLFTGYSRGEVYRFGIVFYDVYGYPSYPLWIGDIKFPFAYEEDALGNTFGLTDLTPQTVNIPATFIIDNGTDIPTIPSILNPTQTPINLIPGIAASYVFYTSAVILPIFIWTPTLTSTLADFCTAFNAGNSINLIATQPDPLDLNVLQFTAPNSSSIYFGVLLNIEANSPPRTSTKYVLSYPSNGFSPNGNRVVVKQLGIAFSLDTSGAQFQAIKDRISGYSYVRLKREQDNSTRLGTGFMQSTFGVPGGKFALTGFEPTSTVFPPSIERWMFTNPSSPTGQSVRLEVQSYYTPSIIGSNMPPFSTGDYFRFIGRTNDYGGIRIKYSEYIKIPDPTPYGLYYVASNDFLYKYDDSDSVISRSLTAVPIARATNSYLPPSYTTSTNLFPIKKRVTAPQSTTANVVDIDTNKTFINMATAANSFDAGRGLFTEWGAECFAVQFDNAIVDYPNTTAIYSNSVRLPIYLVSYERYLSQQYGGWTRADRYSNEYILTNHFQPVKGAVNLFSDVFGGDTYVNYFDWQKTNVNYLDGSGYLAPSPDPITGDVDNARGVAVFFPAESSYNTDLNTSPQRAAVRQNTNTINQSNYLFNDAYSQQNTSNVFISKGYLQSNVVDEPHTIYPSQPKLDGEASDSWRTLLLNNALSVNGNYGEINRVIQFKDKLFFYQNDGVGVASVDERVLANEGDTTQTQLGTGTVLQRFDYISTETGCKHSFAVESTGSSIYHYDSFINKLFKYSVGKTKEDISGMNPLTDVKGLSGFFRTTFVGSTLKSEDKILRGGNRVGIVAAFNSEYNTIYFTFFDQANGIKHTISYNELIDSFESFYDFYPSMYLNMRKRFISLATNSLAKVYTHNVGIRNRFYGSNFASSVTFRVNENSDFVKTFDNFQVNSEVILNNIQLAETVSKLEITNDYQKFTDKNVNFVQKIRSWRLAIPRDETNPLLTIKPRLADKYIDVKFTYDAFGLDKTFRLHDVLTEYSMRSKIVPK
jgi:hypothetical protein